VPIKLVQVLTCYLVPCEICFCHLYYILTSVLSSFQIVRITWILSTVIMGINIYFFCTSFISWLVHSELPRAVNAIISTLVFPFMGAYIAALIYLIFRKVSVTSRFPSMSVSCDTQVEEGPRQDDKDDDFSVC
jgi:fructose-specific phosphotransferase system IIC component